MPVGRSRRRDREFDHAGSPVVLADRAWSGSQIEPTAVLYQRIVSTASNPGPIVGGIGSASNDVLASDVGQWNLHP